MAGFAPRSSVVAAEQLSSAGGLSLFDAVQLALEHDPNVAIEQARLAAARGALEVATGKFDPVLGSDVTEADTRIPLSASTSQRNRTLQEDLALTELFRAGLSIQPKIQLLRSEDLTAGTGAANTGTVFFQVRQPLLRGRGRRATAAGELAAGREVEASRLDVRHTVAQRVLAVGTQYWTVQAAVANLQALRASESSSRELLDNTRKLIAADQVPAAELVQLEANMAAKESARIGGERQLFQARYDLGREIGLDPMEIGRLPLPGDSFPGLRASEEFLLQEAGRYLDEALRRRADLLAARDRQSGAAILRQAAENALLPQLDLVLAPAYSGFSSGSSAGDLIAPLYRNVPGASASLSLALSWPIWNHVARGALVQSDAALRQSALAVDLLVKSIGASVPVAVDAVGRDARQLDRAREAVRLFERAVVNEEKKLRGGTSTILDVITQRDRLDAARQVVVAAELALAVALLRLRFETGTLLGGEKETAVVDASRLITVPPPEEGLR
ncbi:MAG TPA: TolC family protein [Thermoanaerobaculia bacterium]|nr:TolC family protein [Thermoanaerobaculia bacterium]